MNTEKQTVTRAEQTEAGLLRRPNYVRGEVLPPERRRGPLVPLQDTSHTLDIQPTATQHIEMKTSAVDRSKGFLLANVPLFGAFAMGVWLLSGLLTTAPLFSFLGLCILWSSFVLAWLASYFYTLYISAEATARYEARRKWDVVSEEQRRRWDYYDRLTGGNDEA